jgi:hypothetical protein
MIRLYSYHFTCVEFSNHTSKLLIKITCADEVFADEQVLMLSSNFPCVLNQALSM